MSIRPPRLMLEARKVLLTAWRRRCDRFGRVPNWSARRDVDFRKAWNFLTVNKEREGPKYGEAG